MILGPLVLNDDMKIIYRLGSSFCGFKGLPYLLYEVGQRINFDKINQVIVE